jgi:DNA-binding SARP family transcriptional activator
MTKVDILVQQGPPYPIVCISTLGDFVVERLVSGADSIPQYEVLPETVWQGRMGPAHGLFKLLLCAETRSVTRTMLVGKLWPDSEEEKARSCLRSAMKVLYRVLRTSEQEPLITLAQQGELLKLADQKRLWIDVDAIELLVNQAGKMPHSHEALVLLQQAQSLIQGEFLAHDLVHEWATHSWVKTRRQVVKGMRNRLTRNLAEMYLQEGLPALAEEVLQKHIALFPTDQDTLFRLMVLLEQQGYIEEAFSLYERAKRLLASAGKPPTEQIKAVARRLQSQKIPSGMVPLSAIARPPTIQEHEHLSYSFGTSVEQVPKSASLLSCVMMLMHRDSGHVTHLDSLQRMIDQAIERWYQMKPQHDEFTLSRRDALVMIAGLPLSLLIKTPTDRTSSLFIEDFLTQCTASMTACWHLMRGSQLSIVEEVLPAYLPTLIHLTQHLSPYQKKAASLAAQGCLLRGLLALHRMDFAARATYCLQAIQYGQVAENSNLRVAALMHLGNTYYYGKEPAKALATFQEALPFIGDVSPLLGSCIHLRLAMASATCNQHQDTLRYIALAHQIFPEYPENDPGFLYAEYSQVNLSLGEGQAYLDLGVHVPESDYFEQAWNTFAKVGRHRSSTVISERNRIQIINCQAATAVKLGNLENFRTYLTRGVSGAKGLNSKKRLQEAIIVYKEARDNKWPQEPQVKELADLFLN